MYKKAKKVIATTLVAGMAMTGLVGCGTTETPSTGEVSGNGGEVVNVYSARHYDVDKLLFERFEEQTGIKVNLVEGKGNELIERMSREGEDSQADVFLTVGGENIYLAKEKGLLKPFSSETIEQNIDEGFRGEDWVGLTARARIIAYAKDRVNPSDLSTYEDLTSDQWKGKVLVRSSSSSYNQALLSSFIQLEGMEYAKGWAEGIVKNMARQPEGNDRDQVKAIAAGLGDVAVINSYYVSKLLNSSDPEEVKAGESIGLFFPEETHVNISWGGIAKYAKNEDNAVALLEFLTGEEAQKAYSNDNGEYPLNKNVEPSELLKSWGAFNPQDIDFELLGKTNKDAVLLFDQIGWK